MADRICCINPNCRRTEAAEKYSVGEEIVCAKCWKLLPKKLTSRYRDLRKRSRKLDRKLSKTDVSAARIYAIDQRFERLWLANWEAIRGFFLTPAQPLGLDNFLKENGLA